jgi:hypothetical protein
LLDVLDPVGFEGKFGGLFEELELKIPVDIIFCAFCDGFKGI